MRLPLQLLMCPVIRGEVELHPISVYRCRLISTNAKLKMRIKSDLSMPHYYFSPALRSADTSAPTIGRKFIQSSLVDWFRRTHRTKAVHLPSTPHVGQDEQPSLFTNRKTIRSCLYERHSQSKRSIIKHGIQPIHGVDSFVFGEGNYIQTTIRNRLSTVASSFH